MVAEDEVEAEEVDSTYPTKEIHNLGKETEANEEPSQEGGASTQVRAVKTQPNADIAESSAITKKSAERRSVNRLPQADNSQITPRMRNTRTTAASS